MTRETLASTYGPRSVGTSVSASALSGSRLVLFGTLVRASHLTIWRSNHGGVHGIDRVTTLPVDFSEHLGCRHRRAPLRHRIANCQSISVGAGA